MLGVGDYVRHNIFPPIEGVVVSINPMVNNKRRVGVMQESEVVFWDLEDTWDICNVSVNSNHDDNYIDVDFVEISDE